MMQHSVLSLRTAEGVTFSLPLAGPAARFLAWLIDLAAIGILLSVLGALAEFLDVLLPAWGQALAVLLFFLTQSGYGIAMEWLWRGQTVGKRALGLRVMDADGLRLQFGQIVMRNLLRPADALPLFYMVGGISCLVTARAQRLGDLAANTVVIRLRRHRLPDYEQVAPDRFNSLRTHPHLVARLRQRVSPAEAMAALQALLRRDRLDAVARVTLYAEFADHFRRLVSFPSETLEGLTDEGYLRAVVDVLFRARESSPPTPEDSRGGSSNSHRLREREGTLTPALSRRTGEGAQRTGEGSVAQSPIEGT
jgi:uncharacterized RDD family membrane protein YckC